jgi:hypothetical protein
MMNARGFAGKVHQPTMWLSDLCEEFAELARAEQSKRALKGERVNEYKHTHLCNLLPTSRVLFAVPVERVVVFHKGMEPTLLDIMHGRKVRENEIDQDLLLI